MRVQIGWANNIRVSSYIICCRALLEDSWHPVVVCWCRSHCFGRESYSDYQETFDYFSLLWFLKYRSLSKFTWFSSMLESAESVDRGRLVSEQALESIHAHFARFHQKISWKPRLLQSVFEFNSTNCIWFVKEVPGVQQHICQLEWKKRAQISCSFAENGLQNSKNVVESDFRPLENIFFKIYLGSK
jgi:hypothetical protein